jgi:putative hydrolase of the HAD superfamily
MIDTVTFDLWNTLITSSPMDNLKFKNKRIEGFIEILSQINVDLNREKMEKAYDESFRRYKTIQDREEDISTREQVQIILECLGNPKLVKLDEEVLSRLEEVLATQILSDLPELTDGTQDVLGYLKNRNYKLGLICNTGRSPGRILREVLRRRKILQFFEVLTFSDEQRIRKPNPIIFLHTLESLHSIPATSLHIGDELKSDIQGAKRCGMSAGWLAPNRSGGQANFLPEEKPDFILLNLTCLKGMLG